MIALWQRAPAVLAAALILGFPAPAAAQRYAPRDSVTVVPGAGYRAGSFHRFFFGTRYRTLWTTPIRVPVLHLRQFGGGIKPTKLGGGQQTKSLRFASADGREWAFRSVDKYPTLALPPELRETFARNILQDQMSSGHPAGAVIVPPILSAAGVLHPNPILVQMADDPELGEFRAVFAGMLGMIEERPKELGDESATLGGARDIVDTEDLFKRLDDEPTIRVDPRAFLRARLTDVFMGDWDRHADQWRWALVDTGGPRRWLPIPRDRDQVFVRFDGFMLSQIRKGAPQLLNFGPKYGNIVGATWNGRDLDRRFLSGLERPVWDSVVTFLKSRFTDAVIANAVRQEPPEFAPFDGERLASALRARRDRLDQIADKYYRMLAAQVEVFGTDSADEAKVERRDDTTLLTLSSGGREYFRRSFQPGETQEIRVRLQGGPDRFSVTGEGRGSPRIRAIGGGGDDRYTVERSGGIHLYDDRGENTSEGAGINRKAWTWRPDTTKANPELPPRDWGRNTIFLFTAGYGPDVQAIVGYSGRTDWYAFRRLPYSTRLDYGIEVATGKASGRATLKLTRQFENSPGFYSLEAIASGIETLRWYGFGNDQVQTEAVSFYRVSQNEISGGLTGGFRIGKRSLFNIGPLVRWSQTDLDDEPNAARFIAVDRPYGTGKFGMVGARAQLVLEGRDHPKFAAKGGSFALTVSGYPALWDADESVARVDAEGTFALALPGRWRPSLNLLAGGSKTWGKLPFFVAPTLGGVRTLRGYRPDRFAGDAALYGSAELRIPLTRLKLIVPGEQGVFGMLDAGRVYLRGESSDTWHSSFGGGIWFSFLSRDIVAYVGMAKPTKDKEGARLMLGFGFPY